MFLSVCMRDRYDDWFDYTRPFLWQRRHPTVSLNWTARNRRRQNGLYTAAPFTPSFIVSNLTRSNVANLLLRIGWQPQSVIAGFVKPEGLKSRPKIHSCQMSMFTNTKLLTRRKSSPTSRNFAANKKKATKQGPVRDTYIIKQWKSITNGFKMTQVQNTHLTAVLRI